MSFIALFTGLSSAGKTTLAIRLADDLKTRGMPVETLDGDIVRQGICSDLGFSEEDRQANIRRLSYISILLARNGVVTLVAAIAPYVQSRKEMRALAEMHGIPFVEIHVDCPLSVAKNRDPKGLYKLAAEGKIDNFTGVSHPYEQPANPEISLRTDKLSIDRSNQRIIDGLTDLSLLI